MKLPFTQEQFLEVFARYNALVWPAPVLLGALALAGIFFAWQPCRHSGRITSGILAVLWLWAGAVYHLGFFSDINPLAPWFGGLFAVQAAMFLLSGTIANRLTFLVASNRAAVAGALFVAYSLLVYPMLNILFGHGWPSMPTFGAPCPIVIFTFGVLLWTNPAASPCFLVIPLAWAVVGMTAAVTLGMHEDAAMGLAAVIAVVKLTVSRRRSAAIPRGVGVEPALGRTQQ